MQARIKLAQSGRARRMGASSIGSITTTHIRGEYDDQGGVNAPEKARANAIFKIVHAGFGAAPCEPGVTRLGQPGVAEHLLAPP